jgi:ATP-dependent protease ClpP protease subunit
MLSSLQELKNVVPVFGLVERKNSVLILQRLQELATEGEKKIPVLISSGGGDVFWGTAIIEMMRILPILGEIEISTLGIGFVASMAASIWLTPPKEHRMLTKNSQLYFHPIKSYRNIDVGGRLDSTISEFAEILALEKGVKQREVELVNFLAVETKLAVATVRKRIKSGWLVSAEEALKLGLASRVI